MTNFLKILGKFFPVLIAIFALALIMQSSELNFQFSAQTAVFAQEETIEEEVEEEVVEETEEFVEEERVEEEYVVTTQEQQETETTTVTEVDEGTSFWGSFWPWIIGILLIAILFVSMTRRERTY